MAEETDDTPRPLAEISHGPSAFEAFLDRNQKGMIVLAILIVAAAAAWIVIRGIKESAEQSAGATLSEAEAVPELEKMVKEHPDTAAAGSARLVIAAKQWDNGEQDAAIETLRGFIATTTDHAALPSAKASLASRLMQQGSNDEAARIFQELVDSPDARFIAPYALISLGDLAKADGRLDDAEQAYKRAQNDFGTNPFSSVASQHLKLLNFTAPVEIEPPPAPEPSQDESLDPDGAPGASLPSELDGNPLGDIIGGNPTAPVDSVETTPEAMPEPGPDVSAGDSDDSPEEPADEPNDEEPSEEPAEGESN